MPTAEEIAAKEMARKERNKARQRKYHVDARDALRTLRKETGRLYGGGPREGIPVSERRVLTADEQRARKATTDKRYVQATQEALRAMRNRLLSVENRQVAR